MKEPKIISFVDGPDLSFQDKDYPQGTRILGIRYPANSFEFMHDAINWLKIQLVKARGTLAENLCSDHRDKQQGKTCLACRIEQLEKLVRNFAEATRSLDEAKPSPRAHLDRIMSWESSVIKDIEDRYKATL